MLGIGPLEIIFILIIALVIFGPSDLIEAGKSAGTFLRKIVKSPEWSTLRKASKEVRNLPNRLMREAGMDELENEIGSIKPPNVNFSKSAIDKEISAWVTQPPTKSAEAVAVAETPSIPEVMSPSVDKSASQSES
ncbi:MAG: twin-arginine translocase TatA/TatE family subunit [Anaerolineae bacterium]|nr:twin-arginine translocase TatA/TatE family subunit [Anaerolineae bacterium]MBL6965435.1 twin-arginine translocase TatA/TatE family subunit [Anaerolineales bacterium]